MEKTVKVDRKGRLILPSPLRERLGLGKGGGTVLVRLDGSRIILEPTSRDLEKRVEEWRDMVMAVHVEPFTEEVEQSWKWMSLEYARRKIGLRRRVVDVSVLVPACFENPLKELAVDFLTDALTQKRRTAVIPVTSVIGAYHITTRYLRTPRLAVKKALEGILRSEVTTSRSSWPNWGAMNQM